MRTRHIIAAALAAAAILTTAGVADAGQWCPSGKGYECPPPTSSTTTTTEAPATTTTTTTVSATTTTVTPPTTVPEDVDHPEPELIPPLNIERDAPAPPRPVASPQPARISFTG